MPPALTGFPAAARALLESAEPAVLSTLGPGGRPRSWVMWAGIDGDDILLATRPHRGQATDIAGDPHVSLLVYDRLKPTRFVEVRGEAQVEDDADGGVTEWLARQYLGEAQVEDDDDGNVAESLARRYVGEVRDSNGPRVALRIRPRKVTFKEWE